MTGWSTGRPFASGPLRVAPLLAALLATAGGCGAGKEHPATDTARMAAISAAGAGASVSNGASGDPSADGASQTMASGGDGLTLFPADQLSGISSALSRGSTTARSIFNRGSYWAVQARRVSNGVPEVHDHWEDVTLVQAGRATLLSGGRAVGTQLQSPGEHRGGRIIGGSRQPLSPGDLVIVPVGVPHQFEVSGGDSIRYLTIKAPPGRTGP